MQKNFKVEKLQITLQGNIEVKADGHYRVTKLMCKIGSDEPIERCEDCYVVSFCIDTLEQITGLNVGEMMMHAKEIENLL